MENFVNFRENVEFLLCWNKQKISVKDDVLHITEKNTEVYKYVCKFLNHLVVIKGVNYINKCLLQGFTMTTELPPSTALTLPQNRRIASQLKALSVEELERLELYVLAQIEATRLQIERKARGDTSRELELISDDILSLPLDIVADGLEQRVYEEPVYQTLIRAQQSVLDLKEQTASELERIIFSIVTAVKANPEAYKETLGEGGPRDTTKYTTRIFSISSEQGFIPSVTIEYILNLCKEVSNKKLPHPTFWQRLHKEGYTYAKEKTVTVSFDFGLLTNHKIVDTKEPEPYARSEIQITSSFINDVLADTYFDAKLYTNSQNTRLIGRYYSTLDFLNAIRDFILTVNPKHVLYVLSGTEIPVPMIPEGTKRSEHCYHYLSTPHNIGFADILRAVQQLPERIQQYQEARVLEHEGYLEAIQGK